MTLVPDLCQVSSDIIHRHVHFWGRLLIEQKSVFVRLCSFEGNSLGGPLDDHSDHSFRDFFCLHDQ